MRPKTLHSLAQKHRELPGGEHDLLQSQSPPPTDHTVSIEEQPDRQHNSPPMILQPLSRSTHGALRPHNVSILTNDLVAMTKTTLVSRSRDTSLSALGQAPAHCCSSVPSTSSSPFLEPNGTVQ